MQKLCFIDIPTLDIDNYEHSGKLLARQAHEAAILTSVHVCTLAACRLYVLMVSARHAGSWVMTAATVTRPLCIDTPVGVVTNAVAAQKSSSRAYERAPNWVIA